MFTFCKTFLEIDGVLWKWSLRKMEAETLGSLPKIYFPTRKVNEPKIIYDSYQDMYLFSSPREKVNGTFRRYPSLIIDH